MRRVEIVLKPRSLGLATLEHLPWYARVNLDTGELVATHRAVYRRGTFVDRITQPLELPDVTGDVEDE
jgi:hypothetical protein